MDTRGSVVASLLPCPRASTSGLSLSLSLPRRYGLVNSNPKRSWDWRPHPGGRRSTNPVYAFYAFYAWWIHFPQSGALAEGTSFPTSRKRDQA